MRHSSPSQEERSVNVRLDSPVKLFGRNIRNVLDGIHDTCIVDQNVNPTPSFHDGRDDSVTTLFVSNILGVEETLSARGNDELFSLVRVDLFLGKVDNRDLDVSAHLSNSLGEGEDLHRRLLWQT